MTTENKLHRSQATDGGIHLHEAVYAMTGGDPAQLKGMTGEEIERMWNECGETLPWDAEDIVAYVEAGDYEDGN